MVYVSAVVRTQVHLAYLDLSLDQLGVHFPIMYPSSHSYENLAPLLGLFMRLALWFRLYSDTLHDQRVKIEHGRRHDVFPCLKDEHNGDRAFSEDFGGMKGSGVW
jgi:hypothetical protein